MEHPQTFGRWLKQRRRELDLTQDDLALRAGCAVITVKKLEADSLRASRHMIGRLAETLQILPEARAAFVRLGRADLPMNGTSAEGGRQEAPRNPYKGLRAFGEADAGDFFGRAALTGCLLARLAEAGSMARFLAVVGPSGSGKSSLVRAGLIPALRRGELPSSERWLIAEFAPGAFPLAELEAALLRVAVNPPSSLMEQLQHGEHGLLRAIKRVLPADETVELLLVVDQLEELFTLVEDEPARTHFFNNLLAALADPRSRLRVVITVRADFYDRPLHYMPLGEWFRARTEIVLPLSPHDLERAICSPAERVGLSLEPGLVATIVSDVGDQPGTLPLLQYALTELFEHRQGQTLTLDAYQATGGVLGALSRRAEELYRNLDATGQAAARQLILRLIALGEGTEDTRRRVPVGELVVHEPGSQTFEAFQTVLALYGRYRLLTFDHDRITHSPTVELAHEALIGARGWSRLHTWLNQSRDALRVQHRLSAAAAEWARTGQDASFLATGVWLAQYEELATNDNLALNSLERDYLQSSRVAQERREALERERQERELTLARRSADAQRSAARRLRWLVGSLSLFLCVALGLSAITVNERQMAEANLTRSEAQRLAAEASALYQRGGSSELVALLSIR